MIRGNWSLAQEIKQNERKQLSRTQQRQKHKVKLDKLQKVDPIKLYFRIENLEKKQRQEKSQRDEELLRSLREDWAFMNKHKLHQVKIKKFLDERAKLKAKKDHEATKLWGSKSVYFNPELNPLGKVPQLDQLGEMELERELGNWTVPIRGRPVQYDIDPLIEQLGVKLPSGSPPRFYKLVQNTHKPKAPAAAAATTSEADQCPGNSAQNKRAPRREHILDESSEEAESDDGHIESD
ncbi:uncharacterized protein LODBEIA_P24560 [Lodderomyces beijingensis]|uniref:rRNA-processing protein EFG1 n=1 Tax=Lodderomyces beijingensis TaxID=1775926 RepID=A0ABP0ZJB8_9ASCO